MDFTHKDNQFLNENFFLISSDNLDYVKTRMIGYAYDGDIFYMNNNYGKELNDICGCYINIIVDTDSILVQQDQEGSFGIYYYKKDNFFALSNSIVILIEALRNFTLTINEDYVSLFLHMPNTITASETIIKEIKLLHLWSDIKIDLHTRELHIIERSLPEYVIQLDSEAAFNLIDRWHYKWNKLVQFIIENNFTFRMELSGGRDSRGNMTILRKPDLDLSRIFFWSKHADWHTYKDDWEIATKISKIYGFTLNENDYDENAFKTSDKFAHILSFLVKGTHHSMWRPHPLFFRTPIFSMGGFGGELHRDKWTFARDSLLDSFNFIKINSPHMLDGKYELVKRTFKELQKYETNHLKGSQVLWNKCTMRHHFSRSNAETWLRNNIFISPLSDHVLQEIYQPTDGNDERLLLFAVLFDRFLPEINDIKFDSGHVFSQEIRQWARTLNNKYPLSESSDNCITLNLSKRTPPTEEKDVLEHFADLKFDKSNLSTYMSDFISIFGSEIYDEIHNSNIVRPDHTHLLLPRLEAIIYAAKRVGFRLPAESLPCNHKNNKLHHTNVLKGMDDFLFIKDDPENVIKQIQGQKKLTIKDLDLWDDIIKERTAHSEHFNYKYAVFVVPEKHAVFSDFLPDGIKLSANRSIIQLLAKYPDIFFYPLELLKDHEFETYYRHDSRWNDLGAVIAFNKFFSAFNLPPINYQIDDIIAHGDLGDMLRPKVLLPSQTIIFESHHSLLFDNRIQGIGRIKITRNHNSSLPIGVFFGDYLFTDYINLIAEYFSTLFYFDSHIFDKDMIEKLKPDIVINGNSERFLINSPKNGSFVQEVYSRFFRSDFSIRNHMGDVSLDNDPVSDLDYELISNFATIVRKSDSPDSFNTNKLKFLSTNKLFSFLPQNTSILTQGIWSTDSKNKFASWAIGYSPRYDTYPVGISFMLENIYENTSFTITVYSHDQNSPSFTPDPNRRIFTQTYSPNQLSIHADFQELFFPVENLCLKQNQLYIITVYGNAYLGCGHTFSHLDPDNYIFRGYYKLMNANSYTAVAHPACISWKLVI